MIERKTVNMRQHTSSRAPPIRMSLDRPMLDLPRRTSNANSPLLASQRAEDTIPSTQLGFYDFLTHEDDADRVIEVKQYAAELDPDR